MCRLFGFRSVIPSQVHRSLVSAENALVWQSEFHPDGWGVGYYVSGYPHVIKSASTAIQDKLFRRVSGIVSSQTVLAHLRKATKGHNSLINSHPFQYGNWIFAHNGDIPEFEALRGELVTKVTPHLRRFILGDTDSEVFFYLLLTHMSERFDLLTPNPPFEALVDAIQETISDVEESTGLKCYHGPQDPRLFLSFVLTNGRTMIAHQGAKELYWSTYKVCCPERDICPSFSECCEAPTPTGFVNHLIFSSEPLQGENIWTPMHLGELIGVDHHMRLHTFHTHLEHPSVSKSDVKSDSPAAE